MIFLISQSKHKLWGLVTYVDIPIEPMTSVGPDEVLAVLVAFISSEGLAPAGLCWVNCNINVKQIKLTIDV